MKIPKPIYVIKRTAKILYTAHANSLWQYTKRNNMDIQDYIHHLVCERYIDQIDKVIEQFIEDKNLDHSEKDILMQKISKLFDSELPLEYFSIRELLKKLNVSRGTFYHQKLKYNIENSKEYLISLLRKKNCEAKSNI